LLKQRRRALKDGDQSRRTADEIDLTRWTNIGTLKFDQVDPMAKGKAEFLRLLKKAVAEEQETRKNDLVGLHYLKRWYAGLGDEPDPDDAYWFTAFFKIFENHQKIATDSVAQQRQDLFADCSLNSSDPEDCELLIAALAQTIYPREVGAKKKWSNEQWAQLRRDIRSVTTHDVAVTPTINTPSEEDDDLSKEQIARALLKSKEFSARYTINRKGTPEALDIETLRKRVGDASSAKCDPEYDRTVFNFDYILRGDPAKGPACAAGVPDQMAFPQGSSAAKEANALEKQLFSDFKAFFDSLDIPMVDWQVLHCRQAARQLARWTVRQNLPTAQN
jgi:hypothetical protein